jgi:Asp-tRNA(Asn)/Glu-tRNA(Gln) amidotransferase A subunit family amidase
VAEAVQAREALRAEAERALDDHRLLLAPTLAFVAPPADLDEVAARASFVQFTYVFNALGWPALALPAGPAENGQPASIQLVGGPGDDAFVLAAGLELEAALAR